MSSQYVYTLVHQCYANELSLQIFQNIISCLINECDELDQIVLEYLKDKKETVDNNSFFDGVVQGAGKKLGAVAMAAFLSFFEM